MNTRLLTVLGLAALGLAAARGEDWPQFRGPAANGLSGEKQLPAEWSADKNVQWKIKVPGYGWSQPVVSGDRVFITTAVTDNQRKPAPGFGGGMAGGPGGGRPGGGGGFTPPQPGQIMPGFFAQVLGLSDEQKKKVDELQKEVDAAVAKLLTEEQAKKFKEGPPRPGPGAGGGGRPGGGGGFGGFTMPQPGRIMTAAVQDQLKLDGDQKKKLDETQKDVNAKLAKILSEEQNKQVKDMRDMAGRGPGGGGGRPGGGGGRPGGGGGFGGGQPPNQAYRFEIHCLDRATGKTLWKKTARNATPKIATHGSNTYASETPVTDGERVYAYFGMHGVYCFDLEGRQAWMTDLGAFNTQMGWGTSSSPVLHGEHLILQVDNEQRSFLVALDRKTGEEKWRVNRDERTNWGSPIIWKNKVRTELVTPGSQKVRSYDPQSGKLLWELSMGGGQCSSTPVGDEERLYVGVGRRMGGGFGGGGGGGGRPGGGGGGGMGGGMGDLHAVMAGASGDITPKDGAKTSEGVAWTAARGGPPMASPLVYQGYVYVLEQNGGMVSCYEAATGKVAYSKERIPQAVAFWASPWAYDGKVFCLDDAGTTHVLKAGPEFKVLGRNSLKEQVWSSPALAGGALLVRGVENVYCIKQ